MRQFGTVARLVAVFTVLFALSGAQRGAFAQDSTETAATDETAGASASYYVGVSCWPVGDGSQSACSFSASASDGSAVEALWVPAWIVCAEVVDSGGTEWTGDGYHVYGSSLTLTLVGQVNATGGGSYVVRANGSPVDASGDALACSPALVDTSSDDGSTDSGTGDEGTVDGGPVEVTDPDAGGTPAEDGNVTGPEDGSGGDASGDPPADDGVTDGAPPEVGSDGNATSGGGTSDGGSIDEPPVAPDAEGTPEVTGDGTLSAAPAVSVTEDQGAGVEGQDVAAAAPATITVFVYNCTADPGATAPAESAFCSLAPGVALSATEDGVPAPAPVACGDAQCFTAMVDSEFVVTEEVPDNHEPIGDASESIDPVTGDTTIVFVNVDEDDHHDSQLGRLQIIFGRCPSTDNNKETKFTVIPPNSFQASVAEESCGPVAEGTILTITGGDIGDDGVQARIGQDGVWEGYLPPGDDYQVTGSAGTSPALPIVADELTALVIIDYTQGSGAPLTITRTVCSVGDQNSTEITVSTEQPDTGGTGCGPANGQFLLEDGQDSATFSLGTDGIETKWLPVGDYVLTDLSSHKHADVEIVDGVTTYAAVRSVSLQGRLVVRHYYCSDPISNDETDASYFRNTCDEPQSTQITLSDANGDSVDTRSGETFTWNPIYAGTYSVQGDGYCANLNGYTDASGGFVVEPNVTTRIYLYTCAAPDNSGGGDDDGAATDDDGGDDGNSADGDAAGDLSDQEEVGSVTTLPQTGFAGTGRHDDGLDEFALLALALPALLAGAAAYRRRMS